MLQNKIIPVLIACMLAVSLHAQQLNLYTIIDSISSAHPSLKMYDNEIRSMDEAAKGARSWMPPQIGVGQFMTPYNVKLWKRDGDMTGMGSVMISGEQMFPNRKKLDADENYMSAMSSVEKLNRSANLNELIHNAKQSYYEWVILKKKIVVLEENEQILKYMIKNAELRYKNGLDKISAYYKAKAAIGDVRNMRLMFENDIRERRIRLNALMARNPMLFFDIDTAFTLKEFSALDIDSSFLSRSDLKSLDAEMNVTRLKQETERTALNPQFGVRYDNMFGFGGQPMQYTIMGMVKIPLARWSSKMNKATIESLKWRTYALQSQKDMLVNEYQSMVYELISGTVLKKQQLKLYEESILPALRNNYKTMQLGYQQNTEELFMLYDAWEKLNMKQLEYIELINQALQLQISIERILEVK